MSDDWIEFDENPVISTPPQKRKDDRQRSARARRRLELLRESQWLHRQLTEVWGEGPRA